MTAHESTPLARRTVLRGLAGATVAGALGTGTAGARTPRYHVVQGDRCLPVEPLVGDRPVEELYDLHIPDAYTGDNGATDTTYPWYGSLGTQSLQHENTTITFLYDGPAGLSLVVVHGKVGESDGNGGRGVTWTLTGAVLADGDWVVKDDRYRRRDTGEVAATNYDRWDLAGTTHTIDWTWSDARTDGGAFRPLGDEFTVTVDPAYNEAAALWDANHYDGRVTDWQVLSFDGGDAPTRYSLALDERVTLRAGPCAVDVDIDVRSRVNPDAGGVTPVVLAGPDGFDVRRVETESLRVGTPAVVENGGGASPRHGGHVEDVDGDGTAELVVHVPTADTGFTPDTTTARVVGRTTDGRRVVGAGSVRTVDSAGRDDGRDGRNDAEDGDGDEQRAERGKDSEDGEERGRGREREKDDEDDEDDEQRGDDRRKENGEGERRDQSEEKRQHDGSDDENPGRGNGRDEDESGERRGETEEDSVDDENEGKNGNGRDGRPGGGRSDEKRENGNGNGNRTRGDGRGNGRDGDGGPPAGESRGRDRGRGRSTDD